MIDDFVRKNPAKGITVKRDEEKEIKVLTVEEQALFFDCCKGTFYDNFFITAVATGMRIGEIAALREQDIDFDKKEVIIKKTLTTKIKGEKWTISTPKTKNSIRTLPLPEKVYNGLKMMLKQALEFKYFKYDMFVFGMIQPFKETNIQKHKNK